MSETWQQREARERADILAKHAEVSAAAHGLRRAVLELHAPKVFYSSGLYCGGCEFNGCEAEPFEFPCSTYVLARDWPEPVEVAAAVRRQVLTEAANAARNAFGDPAWSPTAQRFVSVASVIRPGAGEGGRESEMRCSLWHDG